MKFYDSILTSLRKFFANENLTEAEIDNAASDLAASHTLENLMSGSGITDLKTQLDELETRLNASESRFADLEAQLTQRDAAITDLQTQLQAAQDTVKERDAAITDIQTQLSEATSGHQKQVGELSAQIASLRVGAKTEKDTIEAQHAVQTLRQPASNAQVIEIKSDALKALIGLN